MKIQKRFIEAKYITSQMYLICEACQTENIFIDAIIDEIDNAPDVDAVEVVRCKDCKNRPCNRVCEIFKRQMDDDCYCSYGEMVCNG